MPHHISEEHLFIFAVIADTHVTEEEASAIGGYDVDTVKLGAARSAYVVRELNRLAPDFVRRIDCRYRQGSRCGNVGPTQ